MQLPIDSNVVEVVCALIFDVVLIGAIELLCQAICSNYNLHQVYDTPRALTLRSRRFAMFGEGLIGIPWLSSLFTVVLTLCVASNIAIGFSVTGRSANVFRTTTYATMVTVLHPPQLLHIDYTTEFALLGSRQNNATGMVEEEQEDEEDGKGRTYRRRPEYLSRRLSALRKTDWCQMCNFTHCNIVAYAYRSGVLDKSLVNETEAFDSHLATCVSEVNFEKDVVMATSERVNQNTAYCKFKSFSVLTNSTNISADNAAQSGTLIASDSQISYEFDYCHYHISHMSCYIRPSHSTRCAAIGKLLPQYVRTPDEQRQLSLIVVKDIRTPNEGMDIERISLSLSYNLTAEYDMRQYTSIVAFLAAIDVAQTFMLDLIPFVSFLYDVPLRQRSEKEENVADVDLRLAVPCVMFVWMAALVLGMTACATWMMFVWRKKRQNFNSFASVPDLLELLVEQQSRVNATEAEDDDEEQGGEKERQTEDDDGRFHGESPTLSEFMKKSEIGSGGVAHAKEKGVNSSFREQDSQEEGSSKGKRSTETTTTNTMSTGTGSTASTHELSSCSPRSRHGSTAQWRKRRGRGSRRSGSGTDGVNTGFGFGLGLGSRPGSGSGLGSGNVGDTGQRRRNRPCVYVAGHDPTVLRVRRAVGWGKCDEGDDVGGQTSAEQEQEEQEQEDSGAVEGGGDGKGEERHDRGGGGGGG